ncbi:vWA domain-containing protein [Streptomyces vinaceus]|uniref:vWA domain-containing protein n=1 Tax=Streptomyces vinaceus TaxID=1960 RepID=UPI0036C54573
MSEAKGVLLPAYVLADESGSMGPYQAELSNGLISLCEGLRGEPMIAAKLRLAVLGFSDDVQVRLAVADMRSETNLPQVVIRGLTNYGAVFADLLQRIPHDVQWLRGQGYRVHRPVVFFLSDGQPTDGDGWRHAHRTLTDRGRTPTAPNIIACGIGEAQPQTMVEVATRPEFAFVAKSGIDIGRAISEFFYSLTSSLVASGQALNSANPQLVVNRPDQFTMAIDEVGQ